MATGESDATAECPCCFEDYNSEDKVPKVFLCGHTMCLDCLEQLDIYNNHISCPICRQEHEVPESGIENFTTNFSLLNLARRIPSPPSTEPMCAVHTREYIRLYCQDCNHGICMYCTQKDHREHNHVYLEEDDTRKGVMGGFSKYYKVLAIWKKKINILDGTIKDLDKDRTESLKLIDSKLQRRIKELKDIAKSDTQSVNTFFDKQKRKLARDKTEMEGNFKSLETKLNQMPQSPRSTTLQLMETLTEIEDLMEDCETEEKTLDQPLSIKSADWCVADEKIDKEILGESVPRSVYIPRLRDFRFHVHFIQHNKVRYHSNDKVYGELTWSMYALREGDKHLGIYVKLLPEDNPGIDSCIANYKLTLLNDDAEKSIDKVSSSKSIITPGDESRGWGKFVEWKTLIKPTNNYIDKHGMFAIHMDNIKVNRIVRK